jgi:hypothetical protein
VSGCSDDAADVLGELPEAQARAVLADMEDAAPVQELLGYDEDSAGGLMTPHVVKLRADATVAQALLLLRHAQPVEDLSYYLYVTDADDHLVGIVPILAAFVPIIAGQGGNAGIQTLTLIVRSLALGEIPACKAFSSEIARLSNYSLALMSDTTHYLLDTRIHSILGRLQASLPVELQHHRRRCIESAQQITGALHDDTS